MSTYSLAIHGGAGTILKSSMTPEQEVEYRRALADSLEAGEAVLKAGGSALSAVEAAVSSMEDCPLFNAGKGSVFNHEGQQEMEGSLMDGKTLDAGAVTMVRNIQNPIQLCRKVLEFSEHIFLCGQGAMEFAKEHKLVFQPDEWFYSEFRKKQLEAAKSNEVSILDHTPITKKYGTVGAVARDMAGNLAAATSTGGMTNKKYGRIGDSPLIGAGTYANNDTCAVSCTGHGEFYIKGMVAYDVSCLMEYKGMGLEEACYEVIHKKQIDIGGSGGLIAVDSEGNLALPFNSDGMYRGWVRKGEAAVVMIYK
jgi:beta-aspartyl-peptidase (threonine type)